MEEHDKVSTFKAREELSTLVEKYEFATSTFCDTNLT